MLTGLSRRCVAAASAALVFLLLGASCGDGANRTRNERANATPAATEPENLDAESRLERGRLAVTVSGRLQVNHEKDDALLRIVSIRGSRFEAVRFLSVGPEAPIELSGGRRVRVAFDLLGWKGNGDYAIESLDAADPETPIRSSAFVEYYTLDRKTYKKYDRVLEPCSLTVDRDGSSGRLHCPRLGGPDSATVGLDLAWDGRRVLDRTRPKKPDGGASPPAESPRG